MIAVPERLDHARDDEQLEAGRERGRQRADREQRHREDEDRARVQALEQEARHRNDDGHRQQERRRDPLRRRRPSRRGSAMRRGIATLMIVSFRITTNDETSSRLMTRRLRTVCSAPAASVVAFMARIVKEAPPPGHAFDGDAPDAQFHIEGLKDAGEPVPEPASTIEFVDVAA